MVPVLVPFVFGVLYILWTFCLYINYGFSPLRFRGALYPKEVEEEKDVSFSPLRFRGALYHGLLRCAVTFSFSPLRFRGALYLCVTKFDKTYKF